LTVKDSSAANALPVPVAPVITGVASLVIKVFTVGVLGAMVSIVIDFAAEVVVLPLVSVAVAVIFSHF
jgi:hypothetical protein